MKASLHKTPTKKKGTEIERPSYVPSLSEPSRKNTIETHKIEKGKFSCKIMDLMTKIENPSYGLGQRLPSFNKHSRNFKL